mmetsp:Transcript_95441/g.269718  ORF Transcript_95441/g.269718 Transcript_95441/m.269718 type:complete len:242 (+) Transcript_95441:806-1531(+)
MRAKRQLCFCLCPTCTTPGRLPWMRLSMRSCQWRLRSAQATAGRPRQRCERPHTCCWLQARNWTWPWRQPWRQRRSARSWATLWARSRPGRWLWACSEAWASRTRPCRLSARPRRWRGSLGSGARPGRSWTSPCRFTSTRASCHKPWLLRRRRRPSPAQPATPGGNWLPCKRLLLCSLQRRIWRTRWTQLVRPCYWRIQKTEEYRRGRCCWLRRCILRRRIDRRPWRWRPGPCDCSATWGT